MTILHGEMSHMGVVKRMGRGYRIYTTLNTLFKFGPYLLHIYDECFENCESQPSFSGQKIYIKLTITSYKDLQGDMLFPVLNVHSFIGRKSKASFQNV